MNYTLGKTGRVMVLRLEHGEPVYASIEEAVRREGISQAVLWIVGGVQNGGVVVGPERDDERPPQIIVEEFSDAREILGVGTLFPDEDGEPQIHMHAAIGKRDRPLVGCPRISLDCWLVDEIVLIELTGMDARRVRDPASGFGLLRCGEGGENAKENEDG